MDRMERPLTEASSKKQTCRGPADNGEAPQVGRPHGALYLPRLSCNVVHARWRGRKRKGGEDRELTHGGPHDDGGADGYKRPGFACCHLPGLLLCQGF